jgi:hypothetical protein
VPDQVAAELLDLVNLPNKGRVPSKATTAKAQRTKERRKAEKAEAEHDAYVKKMRGDPTGDQNGRTANAAIKSPSGPGWGGSSSATAPASSKPRGLFAPTGPGWGSNERR